MSTRSNIVFPHTDGTVSVMYCHHDGYPEGVGQTLYDHYTDTDSVKRLVGLGYVSRLLADMDATRCHMVGGFGMKELPPHLMDDPPRTFPSLVAYLDSGDFMGAEWIYAWERGGTAGGWWMAYEVTLVDNEDTVSPVESLGLTLGVRG